MEMKFSATPTRRALLASAALLPWLSQIAVAQNDKEFAPRSFPIPNESLNTACSLSAALRALADENRDFAAQLKTLINNARQAREAIEKDLEAGEYDDAEFNPPLRLERSRTMMVQLALDNPDLRSIVSPLDYAVIMQKLFGKIEEVGAVILSSSGDLNERSVEQFFYAIFATNLINAAVLNFPVGEEV